MAYPRSGLSRAHKSARRTAGDLTLNSTTWANVDTGLDLVLNKVQVGDIIRYGMSGRVDVEAVSAFFDVATVVSGSPVRSFAEKGPVVASPGAIVSGWRCEAAADRFTISGDAPPYTVTAADLVDGAVTFRLRYATGTASNLTLKAGATTPLDVWVENLGPAQQD